MSSGGVVSNYCHLGWLSILNNQQYATIGGGFKDFFGHPYLGIFPFLLIFSNRLPNHHLDFWWSPTISTLELFGEISPMPSP